MQELKVNTPDNYPLAVTSFAPNGAAKAVVLINSAMGVLRQYYNKFAAFLANEGFQVYSYDYRGIGGSSPKSLRGFEASISTWGIVDINTMIEYTKAQHPELPLTVIGHSVGGQALGLAPACQKVQAIMLVTSQMGNWTYWDKGAGKLKFFWKYMLPYLTKMFGYFPAKRLRAFENLPKGVALEWSKWGCHPEYLFAYDFEVPKQHGNLEVPLLSWSFTDDSYAPIRAVKALLNRYAKADITHRHLAPQDLEVSKIDHFGFFRNKFKDSLWTESLQWLNAQVAKVQA